MSREIRRVPPDWIHPGWPLMPTPLHDRDYVSAKGEWDAESVAWECGSHEELQFDPMLKERFPTYAEYEAPPNQHSYRQRSWQDEEATAYQVYESVTEGTPVSPVLQTRDQLIFWLMNDGAGMAMGGRRQTMSFAAAESFADMGWMPSMAMVTQGELLSGPDFVELTTTAMQTRRCSSGN